MVYISIHGIHLYTWYTSLYKVYVSIHSIHLYTWYTSLYMVYISIHGIYISIQGIRQKECNKCAAATLISAAYRAPHLSLCVPCTTLIPLCALQFLKVCRLVKCRNPRIAMLFPWKHGILQRIASCCCQKLRRIWQKVPQYTSRTNPEANHKSVARFLSKGGAHIFN